MKKIIPLALFLFSLLPDQVLAARTVQTDFGPASNLSDYLRTFFAWAVPITASVAVLMVIYAGYLYMTSQGNQENITLAKDLIVGIVVGVLLLFTIQILLKNVIGTI